METTLRNAINTVLNFLEEHPDVVTTPPNNEEWMTATLTWSETKFFKFEIFINPVEGQTLACVLEREELTYPWGEKFLTMLYNAIDGRDLQAYVNNAVPGPMPPLEDMEDYSDMPPLES